MSNTLPTIAPCPPPGTRDPICLDAAKAAWLQDNIDAEAIRDAEVAAAATIRIADMVRLAALVQPPHMTDTRWERRKARIQIGIDTLHNLRVSGAADTLKLEYIDANEAYIKAAEDCACLGNA